MIHLQRRHAHVASVDKGKQVAHHQKGNESPDDLSYRPALDRGLVHETRLHRRLRLLCACALILDACQARRAMNSIAC
jgi:hypothetical protein